MSGNANKSKLSTTVVPRHYVIELKPDFDTLKYEGKSAIDIEIKKPITYVTVHLVDLEIRVATITEGDDDYFWESNLITYEEEAGTCTIFFPKIMKEGFARLSLEFSGYLDDTLKGFYRCKYLNNDGVEKFGAATQFQATHARRCFPCWDEPNIKASFEMVITVPHGYTALSNMTVKTGQDLGDFRRVEFDKSPPMSSYLLAAVVGYYDFVEGLCNDFVRVRVYTPVGKREQGLFALEVATKVLPFYREYFDVDYPLPKLDLVTIPSMAFEGMENWGLVTFRESSILIDSDNSSAVSKQWIALLIAHEVAHQWFGNLVTMEWWSDLWLNEGYASFIEFLCIHHIFPEFGVWTQFVTDTLTPALELDGLKSSHPVQVPVGLPYEVDEIFDDISFSKGASLIRMLHYFVGDDYFRVGMNEYLTRHYYGNTRTQDLWDALEDASGRPVGGIMSTWTLQKGFPIIIVTQTHVDSTRILKMTQKKFCAGGPGETPVTVWKVPISVSTSRNPRQVALNAILDERAMKVTLSVSPTDWVKINAGSVGYYRVMYPPEMLTLFEPAIKNRTLPSLDRIGVVDDLFALVRAGYTSSVHFLRLLEAFSGETNYTVWTCITNCISTMITLMSDTAYRSEFNAFGRHLYASVAKRLGWRQKKGESHLDTLLRRQVLNVLVAFEDHGVIKEAVKRYYKFIRGSDALPPDLRNACYRAAMWKSDDPHATLSQLMNLYRKSTVNEEKVRILHCLGSFRNEDMLSEVLAFSVSDEVRLEDTVTILGSVAKNPVGRELAWKFFQENCYVFWTKYNGNRLLCQLVKTVTEKFVSESKAKEIEDFFILHPFSATKRTIQQSLEKIRYSALWLDRDIQDIGEFLTGKKVALKKRESVELDVAIIDEKVVQDITGTLEQEGNVASQEGKAIHETDDEVGDVLREAQPVTFGESSSEKSTDFKNVIDNKSGSGMGKNRLSDVSNDQGLLHDLSMKQSENVDVELTETVLAYTTTEVNSALASKYIGNSAISKKSLDGQIFAPITTRPSDFVTQDHDRQKQPNNKPWDFDLLSKYLLSTENKESIHNEGKSEAGRAETEFTVFEELVAQLSHMSHRAERLSNLEVPSDASASFTTKKIIDLSIQMDAIISSTDHTDTSSHDITDESLHADSKTNTTKTDDTEFSNNTKTDDTEFTNTTKTDEADFTNTTSECTERDDTKSEYTDVTDNSDVSEALDSEEILIDSELRPHLQKPSDEYLTRASTDIITNYVDIIRINNANTEDVVNKSLEEIQLLKQIKDISTDKIAQDVIPVSRKSFHHERDRFFKTAIDSSEVAFIVDPSRNKRASNIVPDVCFNYKSAEVESSMDTRKSSDTDEYESDSEADNGIRTSFPYGSIEKLSVIKQDILNNTHNTSPSEIKSVAAKLSEIITTDYTETDSEMCEDVNSTRTTLSDREPEPVMDVIKPPKESLRSFIKSDKRSSRTTRDRDCKLSSKASGIPAAEKVVKPCLKRINIKEVATKMSEILTTDGSDNDQEPTEAVVIPAVSSDIEYNKPLRSSATLAAASPVRVSKKKRISLIKSLDLKNNSEMETAVTDFESSKFNFSQTSTTSQAISKNGSHISKPATDTDSNSN